MTPFPKKIVEKLESRQTSSAGLRNGQDYVQTQSTPSDMSRPGAAIRFMLPGGTKSEDDAGGLSQQFVQSNFQFLQRKLSSTLPHIQHLITIDSRIMHGNPVFSGTRVPVYQVIEELSDGTQPSELLEGYPSLSAEHIQAGLDFAASLLRIYSD